MSLRNTLAYLTALRIPPRTRVPLVHSLHYFPWVGVAHGSLNILLFLTVSQVFPAPLACLIAVIFPQILAGFGPWRGVLEAMQGIRTFPGHGFAPGFHPDVRGLGIVTVLALIKWISLMMLPPDWQVRTVFVFPILGTCAHTWAFLREAPAKPGRGSLISRRRVRAGFLSVVLLFLAFLFPLRAALFILAAGPMAAWWTLRLRQADRRGRARHGLTLQTAAVVSEAAETTVLVGLLFAGLVLFRF